MCLDDAMCCKKSKVYLRKRTIERPAVDAKRREKDIAEVKYPRPKNTPSEMWIC